MIHNEGGKLVMYVFVDTVRPIADCVADGRRVVRDQVKLPTGVRIAWAGQFQSFERSRHRLELVLPRARAHHPAAALKHPVVDRDRHRHPRGPVLAGRCGAAPVAARYHVSVAVRGGLIALAGLDAETGGVRLLYLRISYEARRRTGQLQTEADLDEAIVEGAAKRIRPKVITMMTMRIGLLPVLWSDGTGSDVMQGEIAGAQDNTRGFVLPVAPSVVVNGASNLWVVSNLSSKPRRPSKIRGHRRL
jgi:Cu(I)/Ag(I) efflux system membrane protein CusA/SilA